MDESILTMETKEFHVSTHIMCVINSKEFLFFFETIEFLVKSNSFIIYSTHTNTISIRYQDH